MTKLQGPGRRLLAGAGVTVLLPVCAAGQVDGLLVHGSWRIGPQGDEHIVERLPALGGTESLRQNTVSETRWTEGVLGRRRPVRS